MNLRAVLWLEINANARKTRKIANVVKQNVVESITPKRPPQSSPIVVCYQYFHSYKAANNIQTLLLFLIEFSRTKEESTTIKINGEYFLK